MDPTGAKAEQEQRSQTADHADDHENDTDRVEVDPVLIGTGGDGKIENGSDSENHETATSPLAT